MSSNITFNSPRDRHLFGPGRKRILALDGGGVRGALTIAFLERLEKTIEEIEGKPVALGDWFDLIGGTSTGAIIGCALALGFRASEVHSFYNSLSQRIFYRSRWRFSGIQSKFDARNLMKELSNIVGSRTLDSNDLRTGLAIVMKRIDAGSSWIIMNNPKSNYWDTPRDNAYIGNRYYSLASLVRASTAAPYFFDPQPISLVDNQPPGLFVDGGISPHNNPSLYLYLLASLPQFHLSWPSGADNLTIVSVGTGTNRPTMSVDTMPWMRTFNVATHALTAQISDSEELILALMSWFGQSPTKWKINSELGVLSSVAPPTKQPLFQYLRYNVRLENDWLEKELGLKLDEVTLARYRRMDLPENIPALYQLGVQAAERQIRVEHFVPKVTNREQVANSLNGDHQLSNADSRRRLCLRIGVTGHRDLGNNAKNIEESVGAILDAIALAVKSEAQNGRIRAFYTDAQPLLQLASSLAEGADRIVARLALARGWKLVAPLPFARSEYERDFPQSILEFRGLLADLAIAGGEIIELEGTRENGDLSYYEAGRFIVQHSDLMIAVWDGKLAKGEGGTGQIVREAWFSKIPVVEIQADRPHSLLVLKAGDFEVNSTEISQDRHEIAELVRTIISATDEK